MNHHPTQDWPHWKRPLWLCGWAALVAFVFPWALNAPAQPAPPSSDSTLKAYGSGAAAKGASLQMALSDDGKVFKDLKWTWLVTHPAGYPRTFILWQHKTNLPPEFKAHWVLRSGRWDIESKVFTTSMLPAMGTSAWVQVAKVDGETNRRPIMIARQVRIDGGESFFRLQETLTPK